MTKEAELGRGDLRARMRSRVHMSDSYFIPKTLRLINDFAFVSEISLTPRVGISHEYHLSFKLSDCGSVVLRSVSTHNEVLISI